MVEEITRVSAEFHSYLLQDVPLGVNHRASPPDIAFNIIRDWCSVGAVTRVAECTGLDRLSIPNFYVVRPSALHPCAIVSSGKGRARSTAMLSALFEAYERWAAEALDSLILASSIGGLRELCPDTPIVCTKEYAAGAEHEWVVGFDLLSNRPCFVPLQKVIFPAATRYPVPDGTNIDTNGLAAGTNPLEAICNAILELIERDAVRRLDTAKLCHVDLDVLPPDVSSFAEHFTANGVELSVVQCCSPTNVPVFYCLSRDTRCELSSFFCSGSGAHPDMRAAIIRTLEEVSQSRVGFISSLREDVSAKIGYYQTYSYNKRLGELESWFRPGRRNSATSVCALSKGKSYSTYGEMLNSLSNAILNSYAGAELACVPLRRFRDLFAFRVYCPQMHGLPVPNAAHP